MKKRTLYLCVLSVITIAAICFGTFRYLGRAAVTLDQDRFALTFRDPDSTTVQKNLGPFDSIRIALSNADIELYVENDYSVTYQGSKQSCPTFTVRDGVLTAKEPSGAGNAADVSSQTVIITIPKDRSELKELSLSSDNGDLVVDPSQALTLDTVSMESENGDLSLSDCRGKTLTAHTANGNISMDSILFPDSDIETENGDVTIKLADSLKNYTFSAKSGSGVVTIGDNSYSLGDGDHSSIQVGEGSQKMSLGSGNGDITVEDQ